MRSGGPRDPIAGPDVPEPPFPLKLSGEVIKGFGRGSKELGIPTANIPISGLSVGGHDDIESGVYYGWAGLNFSCTPNTPSGTATPAATSTNGADSTSAPSLTDKVKHAAGTLFGSSSSEGKKEAGRASVHPMVMSIGWNPFYKNTVRSVEVHIMHEFASDFYGAHLNLVILGFIRPELDYVSKESLIEDIKTDIEVARRSLQRPAYQRAKEDPFLVEFGNGGA